MIDAAEHLPRVVLKRLRRLAVIAVQLLPLLLERRRRTAVSRWPSRGRSRRPAAPGGEVSTARLASRVFKSFSLCFNSRRTWSVRAVTMAVRTASRANSLPTTTTFSLCRKRHDCWIRTPRGGGTPGIVRSS